ncbi:hypothetical protein [Aerococcus christensenii]
MLALGLGSLFAFRKKKRF